MTTYLGIDIGTSSVKAVLIDETQAVIAESTCALDVQRPRPLWSEQDPESWWRATQVVIASLRSAAPEPWRDVGAIGLSGQQHGATLLGEGGEVLRPCILWNDGRSADACAELLRRVPDFTTRSSNIPMPGFTAPKLIWLAKHEPDIFARTRMVLLPKDYIRYRLSGDNASDMSDSAGTLWLNVAERRWDDALLDACGMRRAQMPTLIEGSQISGTLSPTIASDWGLTKRRVVIAGGGGDNACSAVGIGATRAGDGFPSLGTSGVIFAATDRPIALPERTLHAFCHALPGRWHGMTVTLSAASALVWIAQIMARGSDLPRLVEEAAQFAADPARLEHAPLFLPYLTGERTPHNDANATAAFSGLISDHGPDALAYAVMEGVAFALADCLDVMAAANATLTSCMLVGGGSRSAFWGQLIADATGLQLDWPVGAEIGAAFGAARLAMIAHGAEENDICAKPSIRKRFVQNDARAGLLAERRNRMQLLYRPRGTPAVGVSAAD